MKTIISALALSLMAVPADAAGNLGKQVNSAIKAAEAGRWERAMDIVRKAGDATDCAMPEKNLERLQLGLELARQRVSTDDSDVAYRQVRRLAGCAPSDEELDSLAGFLADKSFFEQVLRSRLPEEVLGAIENTMERDNYLEGARILMANDPWDFTACYLNCVNNVCLPDLEENLGWCESSNPFDTEAEEECKELAREEYADCEEGCLIYYCTD